jgi:ATP-dependent DNA helicase RecQ
MVLLGIPPTKSGLLVETFARQVAAQLGIEYVNALVKVRPTQEQKNCTNRLQKADNVRGAFRTIAA